MIKEAYFISMPCHCTTSVLLSIFHMKINYDFFFCSISHKTSHYYIEISLTHKSHPHIKKPKHRNKINFQRFYNGITNLLLFSSFKIPLSSSTWSYELSKFHKRNRKPKSVIYIYKYHVANENMYIHQWIKWTVAALTYLFCLGLDLHHHTYAM